MALQKQFRGLAALTGLYEGGNLQLELSRLIQPQFDALEFMAEFRWVFNTGSIAAGNTQFGNFTVPSNQQWLLSDCGVSSNGALAVGTTIGVTWFLVHPGAAQRSPLSLYTLTTTPDTIALPVHFEKPLLVQPGSTIAFLSGQFAGIATPYTASIRYAPINI